MWQRSVPTVQTVQQTVEILQVPFLGLVLGMPVVVHRQVRGRRLCDHSATSSSSVTVGGASDSVHQQSALRCATETGTQG